MSHMLVSFNQVCYVTKVNIKNNLCTRLQTYYYSINLYLLKLKEQKKNTFKTDFLKKIKIQDPTSFSKTKNIDIKY